MPKIKETEIIDRLFLELSQITNAKTEKELQLQQENSRLREEFNFIKQIATGHTYVDTGKNISDQILNQIIKRIDFLEKELELK